VLHVDISKKNSKTLKYLIIGNLLILMELQKVRMTGLYQLILMMINKVMALNKLVQFTVLKINGERCWSIKFLNVQMEFYPLISTF